MSGRGMSGGNISEGGMSRGKYPDPTDRHHTPASLATEFLTTGAVVDCLGVES